MKYIQANKYVKYALKVAQIILSTLFVEKLKIEEVSDPANSFQTTIQFLFLVMLTS